MNNCKQCGVETSNPNFCSRSCAATFNNKGVRRHGTGTKTICPKCGFKKAHTAKTCHTCKRWISLCKQNDRTLKDIMGKGNARVKWATLRAHSKRVMELNNIKKCCKYCGFDVVVDVCHIKSINEFNLTDKVGLVNNIKNLIYLCPNHHAMLDRNLLHIDEIESEEQTARSAMG